MYEVVSASMAMDNLLARHYGTPMTTNYNDFLSAMRAHFGVMWCNPEYFPLLYCLVLSLHVISLYFNLVELWRYFGDQRFTVDWMAKQYDMISMKYFKKIRGSECLMTTLNSILLIYGIVEAQPWFMLFWLYYHTIALYIKFVIGFYKICQGTLGFKIERALKYLTFFGLYLCTKCVHVIFCLQGKGGFHEKLVLRNLFKIN